MKRPVLIAALLALAACGFEPVHGRDYRANQEVDLSAVEVVVDNSRLGQLLKAEIERGINPEFERSEKLYVLSISLTESDIYLFVNPDGTAGRGDVEFRTKYLLRRILDGKQLQEGKLHRVSSYNISETADYATYVSEEDARKRGIVELAREYRLRLSNLLYQFNPKATP